MEGHCLNAVVEFASRKLFIVSFGISTFFEIIFGIPSFVFVVIPFMCSSVIDGDYNLLLATLYLAAIFLCALSGLIAFILHLTGRNKQIRHRLEDHFWYKFKTYDNFNLILLGLLVVGVILKATSGYDAFIPVAQTMYFSQKHGYTPVNPICPEENYETKTSSDMFLDELHQRYACCGWNDPLDWSDTFEDPSQLPYSCCPPSKCEEWNSCSVDDEVHFKNGCELPFVGTIRKFDASTYSSGSLYLIIKVIAYLTYLNSYKSAIENESFPNSPVA